MVKMSDSIICQRFVQNAWKKDLCSNCFKSKEDHVTIPEGKISYRWTSHVNNFPQHGILKDGQNINKEKLLAVSFQTNECEIIGFGGEAYSSDDEFYPPTNDDTALTDTDNEEGIEEFRKLTRNNTDFNSIPANLRIDDPVREDTSLAGAYTDLKLGKPLLDAEGRRQTIRVTVEPFQSSPLSSTTKPFPSETISEVCSYYHQQTDRIGNETKDKGKLEKIGYGSNIITCELPLLSCDITDNGATKNYNNILKFNLNRPVGRLNGKEPSNEASHDRNQLFEKSNIIVKVTEDTESRHETRTEKVSILKPTEISTTIYEQQTKLTEMEAPVSEEKRRQPAKKDSNPICLPLIACKTLEIDLEKPNNRDTVDTVAEANANTNSHSDHHRPRSQPKLTFSAECHYLESTPAPETSICINPQSSFLHKLNKDRSKEDAKFVSTTHVPSKKTFASEENATSMIPDITLKLQPLNSNTNSTKRQAPKPPFGHMTATLIPERNTETSHVTSSVIRDNESSSQYEQQQIQMNFDGVTTENRTDDQIMDHTKLKMDTPYFSKHNNLSTRFFASSPETNSLRRYVTFNPDITDTNYGFEVTDSPSIRSETQHTSRTRSATKCSRSLSCDSIVSPQVVNLSEKSRKYSSATIKVKSKIRKFLRFVEKEKEKSVVPETTIQASRKRIEIIHPLDLNKSSVEILRSSTLPNVRLSDNEIPKKTECENNFVNKKLSQPNSNRPTCPAGRPTKPPPPPRTQSLDQQFSEISKPVRPPPPKSFDNCKPLNSEKTNSVRDMVPNICKNIGDSRHGTAPAKPQRASSMRDRTRQLLSPSDAEINVQIFAIPEYETEPECDQSLQQLSQSFETARTSSIMYCGSETESDICFYSITSQDSELGKNCTNDDEVNQRRRSIVHGSLEDNYGAVVIANHEALSRLLEQINEALIVPNALKTLQNSDLDILFEHLRVTYDNRITVYDWNIYNAAWADTSLVVSVSKNPFVTTRSLPPYLTLYPLIKFTDTIPSSVFEKDPFNHNKKVNAYITIWNEERIQSFAQFCKILDNNCNERGLLLAQLTNAFKHLQSIGVDEISLDEMFACKRDEDKEWRLLILPFDTRFISCSTKQNKLSLDECICHVLSKLLPNTPITEIILKMLKNSKCTSMALTNAVTEYWLWGPCDVNLKTDRQASLQRWLDLERATFLHKIVCKPSSELSLQERWHLVFLVHTDSKILTEASHIFEKQA